MPVHNLMATLYTLLLKHFLCFFFMLKHKNIKYWTLNCSMMRHIVFTIWFVIRHSLLVFTIAFCICICEKNDLQPLSCLCVWPQTELSDLLRPISDQIEEIQNFREKNRGSQLFNHLSAVSESIPALGWVAVVSFTMTNSAIVSMQLTIKNIKLYHSTSVQKNRHLPSEYSNSADYIRV